MKLHCVILAAGKGSRLQMPGQVKALLKINDKPLLFHTLDNLSKLSIDSINIVVGFLGQEIIDQVAAVYPQVKFTWQTELNGTGGAVKTYLEQNTIADEDLILVMNADDSWRYDQADFEKLIASQVNNAVSLFITPDSNNQYSYYRKVILNDRNEFVELTKQPYAREYIVCGTFLATRATYQTLIAQLQPETNGELGLPKIMEFLPANQVKAVVIPFSHWRGINTQTELKAAAETAG